MDKWQDVAREEHCDYLEVQQALGRNPYNIKETILRNLQKPQPTKFWRAKGPNAMDIDKAGALTIPTVKAQPQNPKRKGQWPTMLKLVKEVWSTLGVLGFQCPFIPGFATITKPLTNLLKKTLPFLWTEECTMALTILCNIITLEPVLISLDQDRQFILEVNALQYMTGAILYQADKTMKDHKGKPILRPCGYHLQTFLATEQQYPIYDWEFLAVIYGLKHWDYMLRCAKHPVLVITNHANLTYY